MRGRDVDVLHTPGSALCTAPAIVQAVGTLLPAPLSPDTEPLSGTVPT